MGPAAAIVDQGLSAGTALLVSLVAARSLGPDGFGVVSLVLAVWAFSWTLLRSGISEPLLVDVAEGLANAPRDASITSGAVLLVGALIGAAIAAVGHFGSFAGSLGPSLIVLGAAYPLLLLQDLTRVTHYASHRMGAVFLTGASSSVVQGLALWALVSKPDATATDVVTAWAIGGAAGAVVGQGLMRESLPSLGRQTLPWLRHLMGTGGWFAAAWAVVSASGQAIPLGLAVFLGSEAVGGIRAVQVLFGPLLLLGRAVEMSLLPLLVRASASMDVRLAQRMALVSTMTGVLYSAVVLVDTNRLLSLAFGDGYARFSGLVPSLALMSTAIFASTVLSALLKATRAAREYFLASSLTAIGRASVTIAAAAAYGLDAAVWCMAIASVAQLIGLLIASKRMTGARARDGVQ